MKKNQKQATKKLGKTQKNVLASLKRHGSWHRRCGWLWGNLSSTERVMNSLMRAGYVIVDKAVYHPNGMNPP